MQEKLKVVEGFEQEFAALAKIYQTAYGVTEALGDYGRTEAAVNAVKRFVELMEELGFVEELK